MDTVRLGRTNLKVSRLALGAMGMGDASWRSWVLDETASRPVVAAALEAGINLFDTCDFYSLGRSEEVLGKLLGGMAGRDEVIIATKVGNPMGRGANNRGYSRKHILDACDASLRRLGTDYIDLYQTHIWDPDTDIEEMVDAFADLVRAGKVRYVGATDMPAWQFAKAIYHARHHGLPGFVSMQNHYNLVWREHERELIPLCRAEGIGLIPYSPMARGFLCDPDRQTLRSGDDEYADLWYGRPEDRAVAARLADVASARGVKPGQVAIAWVAAQPGVAAPVIGANSAEQVADAVAALDLILDDDETALLTSVYLPRPTG